MPKSRKPRKASRKTSRKGKKCPPGCVKKTLKRSRKSTKRSRRRVSRKASRKRKSVKRKASRKRRSVKRKASRKRRSVKRKASRKRRSVKRKASRKRRSVKRKVSRKRRSVKRKVSRKRRSVKRKSRKRKSAKRKSRKRNSAKRKSRKRKSVTKSHKFRFWGKIKGFIPGTRARSNRLADQKIRKEQKAHLRKTYKEYLQPLIKNYYPGRPQSLYDDVAKYYIEKILHQSEARANQIVQSFKSSGRPLIPMKFSPGYSIDKYKKVNKLKIGQAYRMYYRAMHKEHLEDCKKTGGYCIKSRSKFVENHIRHHNERVESAKLIAATKSLYGKCLKNAKRISKAKQGTPYSKMLEKAQTDYGCQNLPDNLKTKMMNEIRMEAKTAKRVKQGKFARWSRSLKKNKGAAVTNYQKSDKYNQYKAAIPWRRRTPAGKLAGCRKGRARLQELSKKGQSRNQTERVEEQQLLTLYNQRGCKGIINSAKTAPAKPAPTSLF